MPIDTSAVAREARRVRAATRQRGVAEWDDRHYDFLFASGATYPFQWFWDSAFHAIALLHVDPELAKQEVRCLMQGAQPDGFIPHMLLWEKSAHDAALREYSITLAHTYYTATIQPPVIARAVARIFEATGDVAFVREVLPPILRFFRWLKAYRDPDDDGLVAIIQPDESGLDASPKYDRRMRVSGDRPAETLPQLRVSMKRLFDAYAPLRADPARLLALDVFVWEDVMVNVIYADGLRALGGLCLVAGFSDIEARELEARARRVMHALQEKCWDDRAGAFWDLDGWDEERARVLTFSALFPIVLADLDPVIAKRLVEDHLLNEKEFWLPYPVPTVAAADLARAVMDQRELVPLSRPARSRLPRDRERARRAHVRDGGEERCPGVL